MCFGTLRIVELSNLSQFRSGLEDRNTRARMPKGCCSGEAPEACTDDANVEIFGLCS